MGRANQVSQMQSRWLAATKWPSRRSGGDAEARGAAMDGVDWNAVLCMRPGERPELWAAAFPVLWMWDKAVGGAINVEFSSRVVCPPTCSWSEGWGECLTSTPTYMLERDPTATRRRRWG
jgi:hypothetical protein